MGKIKNFDIAINKCLWDIKPTSETLGNDRPKSDISMTVTIIEE